MKMTIKEWEHFKAEADRRMKANNGHRFITVLKTRCQFCGRSPKTKTRCGQWFQAFLIFLAEILIENGYIE